LIFFSNGDNQNLHHKNRAGAKNTKPYTKIRRLIVGAAFQPRSGFIAAKEIAAGKPLPHIKIKRLFQ
jgi:hypothetical protein